MIRQLPIELSFEQKKDDVITFSFEQTKRSHAALLGGWGGVIIFLVIVAYLFYQYVWLRNKIEMPYLLYVFCYGLYIFSFRVKLLYRIFYWPRVRRDEKIISAGDVLITINDEEIQAKSAAADHTFTWPDFEHYVSNEKYLILYSASGRGIIIPKSVFLLAQEAYDTEEFIERKLSDYSK